MVVRDGKVRGETLRSDLGLEADVWDRIPYAQPPVGQLRYHRANSDVRWPFSSIVHNKEVIKQKENPRSSEKFAKKK